MKICLATVHASTLFTPLALLYLKAYLIERHGAALHDVEILEIPPSTPPEDVAARILRTEPDVLGLSCYVWNVEKLMAATRLAKAQRPGLRIVCGGPEVGPVAERVLEREPQLSAVVVSEGEVPFAEIVERWSRGDDIDDVRGIWFRRGDAVVATAAAPIQDLDDLASPHLMRLMDHAGRIVCIETQRGCVFRCSFCFYNKDLSIRNRRFDLDRVKDEIRSWIGEDVHTIFMMDPIFNLNAERAKEICRFIAANNTRRVKFRAEVWAEFIDEEMARLLSEANFHFLEVGLQTTDQAVLMTVERRLRMKKFVDGIRHLNRFKLPYQLQLIFGLPGETLASFKTSLNFAVSLDPPDLAVFPLMVLPGTELWKKADTLQLAFDPEPPYNVRSHPSMSEDDIAYGGKIVKALDLLANARTFRMLARERGVTFADLIDAWIAWGGGAPPPEARAEVDAFVDDFCRRRAIPPALYRGFASLEFRA